MWATFGWGYPDALVIPSIVHDHGESPQGEAKHDAGRDQLEGVDGVDVGEARPAHDRRQGEQANGQRHNHVSPGWAAIRHAYR